VTHYQHRYQHPVGVKSSTALILECRPRLALICLIALHVFSK